MTKLDATRPICRVCEAGNLTREIENWPTNWQGVDGMVLVTFDVCSHCEGRYADQTCSAMNKAAVSDFRSRVEEEQCHLPPSNKPN